MPHVLRDADGTICAVSAEPTEGFEPIEEDAAELAEFEQLLHPARSRLQESDLEVVRVLDDLVNLLIDKDVIRFTDLPPAAQRKLIERRGLRRGSNSLDLLGDDAALL